MPDSFHVVFAVYPNVTQLDFTGPLEVLCRVPGAECIVASEAGGDLEIGPGMVLSNLPRLADVAECSLLCVPGGFGTVEALSDKAYLAQVRRLGMKAKTVTSVCTGSLLLAAAGLLGGKRAACHWALREQLTEFGVIPDSGRVVRDGNVVTGGGVTAGIDMALQVLADIAGEDYAKTLQLGLEYAPAPPFQCGRPELAQPEIVAAAQGMMVALVEGGQRAAKVAAAKLNEWERPA